MSKIISFSEVEDIKKSLRTGDVLEGEFGDSVDVVCHSFEGVQSSFLNLDNVLGVLHGTKE